MNLPVAAAHLSGWEIVLGAAAVVILKWFAIGCHKAEISAEVRKRQAKPRRIRWQPTFFGSRDSESFYEVTMTLPSGRELKTVCGCHLVRGVSWKEGLWDETTKRKDVSETGLPSALPLRIVADCSRCGFGIPIGAEACPNCGTEIES